MINVSKSFLPNQEEYQAHLKKSWDKIWITNRGELVKSLELQVKNKFNITNMIATTNGTLPLQIAIKALQLKEEIITTPFSYIATASSIVWEGCTPVFVDIDKETFNIDPSKIEAHITSNTTGIVATHVFGNPCNITAIKAIADKYNLKVIYDAAHAFGVEYKKQSIFEYGDVSTCSFHATKIFHTGEGGAMFSKNKELHDTLYYHHNFGHDGPEKFHGLGINAKMSEFQAAMGLTILPYFDDIFYRRKLLYDRYLNHLEDNKDLVFQKIKKNVLYNYAYMPVVFKNEKQLYEVKKALNEKDIHPRRYFYPALNTVDYLGGQNMPIAENIAKRILCLPLYFDLTEDQVDAISLIINKTI
ncbi:DegT/DnrJ/EryC1/StrS family aminotransferase [Algibacter amylolyticus]|uniref:DegT/DnrJ/EryC1/StrS family aminotransferase n=1 Tax=Algibacter amylolyticus TaxID=1608400 RepID=A0A5M7B6U5_9FLAO|nr:DegT/DnrJ/EryC1/StrS family aminotransferase [Algibacter amylolyticus]KAA5824420.1 DegT/DnrJ/EryC1/StrS family aminotransferase [Algibacter amylolyticus]MBB5269522.1 dTDP-4-amino-4,6-dideoxygalactose transaminase [Algibacter amylolyticus]TSJ75193.1 DegT/DnrJ/EryC1/StrS family aminotransferase [Algibacter amylolyticus]